MIKNTYFYDKFNILLKALRRANGRALRRKEKKLESKVQKALNDQRNYILKKSKKLFPKKMYGKKASDSDIDKIFEDMDDAELTGVIATESAVVMTFGAKYRIRKHSLDDLGISFTLDHPRAIEYLKSERPLIWAKMSETTKDHIKPILQEAVKTGQSYTDTAEIISKNFGFSQSRAQMIATNEIGHAYAYGNQVPIWDAVKEGENFEKRWSITGDGKETDECLDNDADDWIPFEDYFTSNDFDAPRDDHPRCRCDTLYKRI